MNRGLSSSADPMRFTKLSVRTTVAALTLGATLLIVPHFATADGDDTALINLIALASQRLTLAEPVARWKWANHQPITDSKREAELLLAVEKRAIALGIDPSYARAFFADQIAASKEVQRALFDTWRATPPSESEGAPPDLAASTRPQLDRLTHLMLATLARMETTRNAHDCPLRVARSIANWKSLTRYGSTRSSALNTALSHVCTAGGIGAVG